MCFMMICEVKLLVLSMESSGFEESDVTAVSIYAKRIVLFNKKIYFCRDPFRNVVRQNLNLSVADTNT